MKCQQPIDFLSGHLLRLVERTKKTPLPILFLVLFMFVQDEYNQQATKRAISPGTDSIFRATPEMLQFCRTLVCLSGNDKALPAWAIHDYIRAQFPGIALRM